jgi:hypothetical protein
MGQFTSSSLPPPNLPADAIQAIIAQTSTSAILDSALYVNKKWNEIGRRNVIWLPRYKQLTGIALDPQDFQEYEVFPLFLQQWMKYTGIWLDKTGKVTDVAQETEWIDTVDPAQQKSVLLELNHVRIENGQVEPTNGVFVLPWKPVKLLVTTNHQRPELFLLIREVGQPIQVKQLPFYTITPKNDLLETRLCSVCNSRAKYVCDACGDVMYCSRACMWEEDYKDKSI